jgi:hypothetical protein
MKELTTNYKKKELGFTRWAIAGDWRKLLTESRWFGSFFRNPRESEGSRKYEREREYERERV